MVIMTLVPALFGILLYNPNSIYLYGGIILMLHKKCIKEGKREWPKETILVRVAAGRNIKTAAGKVP